MATTGRKRIYDDPMGVYNIRLTGAHAIKARRIGKGNVGQGVRACVEQAPMPTPVGIDRRLKIDRRRPPNNYP